MDKGVDNPVDKPVDNSGNPVAHIVRANIGQSLQTDITPERAGWKLLGFQVYGLGKGETYEANSGGNELCLVFLGGDATVKVGGETWHIKGGAGFLPDSLTASICHLIQTTACRLRGGSS